MTEPVAAVDFVPVPRELLTQALEAMPKVGAGPIRTGLHQFAQGASTQFQPIPGALHGDRRVILPTGMPYMHHHECLLLLKSGEVVHAAWEEQSTRHTADGPELDGFYFYCFSTDDILEFDDPIAWAPLPAGATELYNAWKEKHEGPAASCS